ncbi:MAG: nuclear transport factor 2 family protein, partial [Stackebrandtia sp.]
MTDISDFAVRYCAVWNEPDLRARQAAVAKLWTSEAVHHIESGQFCGHTEIAVRIGDALDQLVRSGERRFRLAGEPAGHHDAVTFPVELATVAGTGIDWQGEIFVHRDGEGRIVADYQFGRATVDASVATRSVVDEFLRRSAAGDPERIADCYASAVDWKVNWPVAEHPDVPWIRPRASRADVAEHYRVFPRHCEGTATVDDIQVAGGHAVVFGVSDQRVRATCRRFSMRFELRLT